RDSRSGDHVAGEAADLNPSRANKKTLTTDVCPQPGFLEDLRRIATDGVAGRMAFLWRATAPAVGEKGHPGKVGPSVGINLPKVVSCVPRIALGSPARNISSACRNLYRKF